MAEITTSMLTQATLDGSGIFDVLMRATKAHLDSEFSKNRIKGAEYATVYLGSLESVMQTSLSFLLQQQKTALEAQLIEKQIAQVAAQTAQTQAQTKLVEQQTANALLEADVLRGQKCKLDAEYDNTMQQTIRTTAETALMTQKVATEKAQTTALGVDDDSVIGRQKGLYKAQTDGFTRDAEQKVAKVMVDSWNVRRTTDEATVADETNKLNDATVGRAVTKMLAGVGA